MDGGFLPITNRPLAPTRASVCKTEAELWEEGQWLLGVAQNSSFLNCSCV